MKEILNELEESLGGIIGSFVIGKDGSLESSHVPDIMADAAGRVSKTLHHVTRVIRSTRTMDKLTVVSDNALLIALPLDDRILVVLTEKGINQALFKLMSNMAISKLQAIPSAPAAPPKPSFDCDAVCSLYEKLYSSASKRLANIIGPKSAVHFSEGSEEVISSHLDLFEGLSFDRMGRPDMDLIKSRAKGITDKDRLTEGLDDLLLSMLDTVRSVAGPKQEQKAMDEIQKIKSSADV